MISLWDIHFSTLARNFLAENFRKRFRSEDDRIEFDPSFSLWQENFRSRKFTIGIKSEDFAISIVNLKKINSRIIRIYCSIDERYFFKSIIFQIWKPFWTFLLSLLCIEPGNFCVRPNYLSKISLSILYQHSNIWDSRTFYFSEHSLFWNSGNHNNNIVMNLYK